MPQQLDGVAEALREILESDEAITRVRVAALEALGHLLALKADVDWAREVVDRAVDRRRDACRTGRGGHGAVANCATAKRSPRSSTRLTKLPLDEPPARIGLCAGGMRFRRRDTSAIGDTPQLSEFC